MRVTKFARFGLNLVLIGLVWALTPIAHAQRDLPLDLPIIQQTEIGPDALSPAGLATLKIGE